jgi:hypothetical protein
VSGFASRQRFLGLGLLVLTFVVGGFAGAAVQQVRTRQEYEQRQQARRERPDDRGPRGGGPGGRQSFDLRTALEFTPEQRERWDSITARREREIDAFWAVARPQMDSIVSSARAEIRAMLTPVQVARWDSIRASRRRDDDRDPGRNQGRTQQQPRPPGGDRHDRRP